TGSLALVASSPTDGPGRLQLLIGPPLGGSGDWNGTTWADTLLLQSISPAGDTITWLGWRTSTRQISGVYVILGGPFGGQGGRWGGHLRRLGWRWTQSHATDPRPAPIATANFAAIFGPFAPVHLYPVDGGRPTL